MRLPPPRPADSLPPGPDDPVLQLFNLAPGELPAEEGLRSSVYEAIDALKKALDVIRLREASGDADKQWQDWVRTHWAGAPFTTNQLQAALSLTKTDTFYPFGKPAYQNFQQTHPPGTPSQFDPATYISGDSVSALIRRAWAIQSSLANLRQDTRVAQQDLVAQLRGALSAVGLVVAVIDLSALFLIPAAGSYVGAGNPAEAVKAGFQVPIDPNASFAAG